MIKKFDTNAVDDLILESLGSDENLEIYLNDIPEDEALIAQLMKEVLEKESTELSKRENPLPLQS